MKFELHETDLSGLERYLKSKEVIKPDERITRLAPAGDGNMNLTLRAELNDRSLIVKQANPFVQKYPSIAAPVERAEMEHAFFKTAKSIKKIAHYLPWAIFHDGENHIQVMEDLGRQGDYSKYYSPDLKLPPRLTHHLVEFLKLLHSSTQKGKPISNLEMRKLNHAHIFEIPFSSESGLNLDETQAGLQYLAEKYVWTNSELRKITAELGEVYLSANGPALLHGDFFPGSWLDTEKGVKIIDPEFCFSGPIEFELGVLKAHLIFCGMSDKGINTILRRYGDYDKLHVDQFAGIEMLRRLFGVAQLPLARTISEKEELTLIALNLLNL